MMVFSDYKIHFVLLPLSVFHPFVLSHLPLSCSHGHICRNAGDMWHSDICHLMFATADALYKCTKSWKGHTACSLLVSHIISEELILRRWLFLILVLFWKVSVPACRASHRSQWHTDRFSGMCLGRQRKEQKSIPVFWVPLNSLNKSKEIICRSPS